MNYTITTYDNNGNEIVSRNYRKGRWEDLTKARENYADQIESILEDSHTYLEEQAVDYAEKV